MNDFLASAVSRSGPAPVTGRRARWKEKKDFLQLLRIQLDAGLGLLAALDKLVEHGRRGSIEAACAALAENVRQGHSFGEAASVCPVLFDRFEVAVLVAAEQQGTLSASLAALEGDLEWRGRVKRTALRAAFYPWLIVNIAFLAFNMNNLVNGALLGVGIRFVLFNSAILFIAMLFRGSRDYTAFRAVTDRLLLELPGIRRLFGDALLAHQKALFFGSLARTLDAGGSVRNQVDLLLDRLGSPVVREDLRAISRGLLAGQSFKEATEECRYISAQEKGMIATGEISGGLPGVLEVIAGYLRDDLEQWLVVMSRALPVVLLVLSGLFVLVQLW